MPIGCAFRAMMGAALTGLKKLYTLGVEDVAWVEGYIGDWGSAVSKEADHLALYVFADILDALSTWVTDNPLSLTAYTRVWVDWELDAPSWQPQAYIVVSTSKMGELAPYDARFCREAQAGFSRRLDSLDISELNGSFYVRVHLYRRDDPEIGTLRVYRVWLE